MRKIWGSLLFISFIIVGIILLFENNSIQTNEIKTITTSSSEKTEEKKEPAENKVENQKKTMIFASDKKISTENLTLLDSYSTDVNKDGLEDVIEMYTSAMRNSNGEMMWDDGQNWLLIVKEKDHVYVLFEGYVQLGTIKYRVFTEGEQNIFHLLTIRTGSAEMVITDYIYNKEDNGFEQKVIYNPDFVNSLHISQ